MGQPAEFRRRQPAAQQRRRAEIQHGDLEEDDPEDQHVDAMRGQQLVELVRRQQVHGRPARQRNQQRRDAADQQGHDRDHGVQPHQRLGRLVELQARFRANPEL
jgi:hypothetical protein